MEWPEWLSKAEGPLSSQCFVGDPGPGLHLRRWPKGLHVRLPGQPGCQAVGDFRPGQLHAAEWKCFNYRPTRCLQLFQLADWAFKIQRLPLPRDTLEGSLSDHLWSLGCW